MKKTAIIYVAGHTGLIGSAMLRRLEREGYGRLFAMRHSQLDLQDGPSVESFFSSVRPQYVVVAAGRVGGILENQAHPADFMNENMAIQYNILRAAHRVGVTKLILFGSSCAYPRECPQPMAEEALLSGKPEPTSLPYAISKLAGIYMCLAYNKQDGEKRFIPVIPNSAYGPNDNFDPRSSHVLSALLARLHQAKTSGAKTITLWGSGSPRREFVHADDIAGACLHLLQQDCNALDLPLNIGVGSDVSIKELAEMIAGIVGYAGRIEWDPTKPDGAPRKLLDSSRLRSFGWKPKVVLREGLSATYQWYMRNAKARQQASPEYAV